MRIFTTIAGWRTFKRRDGSYKLTLFDVPEQVIIIAEARRRRAHSRFRCVCTAIYNAHGDFARAMIGGKRVGCAACRAKRFTRGAIYYARDSSIPVQKRL